MEASPEWFIDPSLWTTNMVFGQVTAVPKGFTNNRRLRSLWYLQKFGILPTTPPTCPVCDRPRRQLVQRNDLAAIGYEFKASRAMVDGWVPDCPGCKNGRKSITDGTNLSRVTLYWEAYMHLHVLLNANYNHRTAKEFITQAYGNIGQKTLDQWVIWILEIHHVWVWSKDVMRLGNNSTKWIGIDDSFC